MADLDASSSNQTSESRSKLFYQARVPQYVDITYPAFVADECQIAPHTMCVAATPAKGAKLHIEFTQANIDPSGLRQSAGPQKG